MRKIVDEAVTPPTAINRDYPADAGADRHEGAGEAARGPLPVGRGDEPRPRGVPGRERPAQRQPARGALHAGAVRARCADVGCGRRGVARVRGTAAGGVAAPPSWSTTTRKSWISIAARRSRCGSRWPRAGRARGARQLGRIRHRRGSGRPRRRPARAPRSARPPAAEPVSVVRPATPNRKSSHHQRVRSGWVIVAVLHRDRRRGDGNHDSEMIRFSRSLRAAEHAPANGMKFVCDRCQTKYSIADERVRGKVLKVKCKTCANVITVREARAHSSAGVPTLSAGWRRPLARRRPGGHDVPMETPGVDSERTQLAHVARRTGGGALPGPAGRRPRRPRRCAGRPARSPRSAPADDRVQWYMALDGNRTGPFTRSKLVDRLVPLAKSADVHIWNEKLDGWKPPADVPEIAAEITRRRAPAPPPPPLARRAGPRRRRCRR